MVCWIVHWFSYTVINTSFVYVILPDINECTTDNGGCNHTCVNEVGSYHCDCDDGFELNEDLHGCSGIYDLSVYYGEN